MHSFPKHLDLALAPNKTNKGLKSNKHDKSRHIVTCFLAVFRLYTFSLMRLLTGDEKEGRCEGLVNCLTLSTILINSKLDCQKS